MTLNWEKRLAMDCMKRLSYYFPQFVQNETSEKLLEIIEVLAIWGTRDIFEGKTLDEAIKLHRKSEKKVRHLFEK